MRPIERNTDGYVNGLDMRYYSIMPKRWSFQVPDVRNWVEEHMEGRVLNACAGEEYLDYDGEIVRNDVDPEKDADHHLDVVNLSDELAKQSFDCIVFDPPFSNNQAESTYGVDVQTNPGNNKEATREFHKLLRPTGVVIQLGFTTTCMPGKLGYDREAVAVFNTLGRQHDWLGVVDRRLNGDLDSYG